MNIHKINLVKQWLIKADHDLKTAFKVGFGDDAILDTAIFHCQQAVEKALKGFLVFHDQPLLKTHDLRLLIEQAIVVDQSLSDWENIALRVSPYATLYRYPGESLEPNEEEFNEVYHISKEFYLHIYSKLSHL